MTDTAIMTISLGFLAAVMIGGWIYDYLRSLVEAKRMHRNLIANNRFGFDLQTRQECINSSLRNREINEFHHRWLMTELSR